MANTEARDPRLWSPAAIAWLGLLFGIADSYLLDLLSYLAGLGLIWVYDLQSQHEPFQRSVALPAHQQGRWLWPALTGAPRPGL